MYFPSTCSIVVESTFTLYIAVSVYQVANIFYPCLSNGGGGGGRGDRDHV